VKQFVAADLPAATTERCATRTNFWRGTTGFASLNGGKEELDARFAKKMLPCQGILRKSGPTRKQNMLQRQLSW